MADSFRSSVSTLGDLKLHGKRLYAHCTAPYSGHGAPLDLDALIRRFGADYDYINETLIAASCVCRKCGHKGAKVNVVADSRPVGAALAPFERW